MQDDNTDLKSAVRDALERKGVIKDIRARLRASVFNCLDTPGRSGQHGQLAGRRPRPAAPERWAQLGRAAGHPPGATRRQPVGQS